MASPSCCHCWRTRAAVKAATDTAHSDPFALDPDLVLDKEAGFRKECAFWRDQMFQYNWEMTQVLFQFKGFKKTKNEEIERLQRRYREVRGGTE